MWQDTFLIMDLVGTVVNWSDSEREAQEIVDTWFKKDHKTLVIVKARVNRRS